MPNIEGRDGSGSPIFFESTAANTDADPAASVESVETAVEANTVAVGALDTRVGGFQSEMSTVLGNFQTAVITGINGLQTALLGALSTLTNTVAAALPQKTSIESDVVSVGTSLTVLLEHTLTPRDGVFSVEVLNSGANAFNSFQIEHQIHPSGTWQAIENALEDWADPLPTSEEGGRVSWTNGINPFTLAGGATARFQLTKVSSWSRVRFRASVATGTTDAQVRLAGGTQWQ